MSLVTFNSSTALISVDSQEIRTIKIEDPESYTKWKVFCQEALYNSKKIISENDNQRTKEQRETLVTVLERLHWWIVKFGENGIDILIFLLSLGGAAFAAALVGAVTTMAGGLVTPWGIAAALTAGGVFALTINYARYLYSHKELVLLALSILSDEKIVYEQYQETQNKQTYVNVLFIECVMKLIDELHNKKIMLDDYSLPMHPICLCGNELIGESFENISIYDQIEVNCNVCDKIITNDSQLYYCSKKSIDVHKNGFDLCIPCARAYGQRLKRYHAFIIFDSRGFKRQDPNSEFKDGDVLYDLFKDTLGYHSVKLLKDNEITKNNIFNYLNELSKKDDNDVIVICYCGHGNNPENGEFIFETSDGVIKNDEFLFHLLGNSADKLYNFKTKDVLLILNACRSGSFKINDHNYNNVDSKIEDENYERFVNSLNEFKNNMKKVTKSMFVISAATETQDAMPGTISPFVTFFVESMRMNKSKDASPKDIYKQISEKSGNDECKLNFGFLVSDWATPNVASQTGKFAETFSLIPVHKIDKIVEIYNKHNELKENNVNEIDNMEEKKQMYIFDEESMGKNITLINKQTIKQIGYNYKHYNAYSKYTLNDNFSNVAFKILSKGNHYQMSLGIGIIPIDLITNTGGSQQFLGSHDFQNSIGYWGYDGEIHKNGSKIAKGDEFEENDIISFKIDFKKNNIQFYKNNLKQGECIEIENGIKYKACVTLLRDGQSVLFCRLKS